MILSVFENQIITDLMDKTNISHPMYLNEKLLDYDKDYIEFDDKYIYRPDLVAFHVYREQSLFPIILLVNKVASLIQFNPMNVGDRIYLPQDEHIEILLGAN